MPWYATWTIAADGVRSTTARELGVQRRIGWLDKFALTSHFAGVPELATAELHVFPGGYFAAAPVGEDRFSLNLIVDRGRLRQRVGDWDGFFAEHLERVPELHERMQGATRVAPVRGTGPLAFRTDRQTFDGAALLGDACGYIDPMTGEGIYFALRGAEVLATELDAALHARSTQARDLAAYVRARRREIGPRLVLSKLLQRGVRHPAIARKVLSTLQTWPGIADLLVSTAGDYVPLRELWRPTVWRHALCGGGSR
jgi:flavin-dependent dehydrogenase